MNYWQRIARSQLSAAVATVPEVAQVMRAEGFEDFDPEKVRTEVRFLQGADPAFTVRQLQILGAKLTARQDIMREMPEVDDVEKSMARIDADDLRQALMGNIVGQVQNQLLPPQVVSQIIKLRNEGMPIEEAFEEVIGVEEEQEEEAAPALGDLLLGQGAGPTPALPGGPAGGPPPALPEGIGIGL